MNHPFPVQQSIHQRHSVRSYTGQPLSPAELNQLKSYSQSLVNPFGVPVRFHFLEHQTAAEGEKLGTYGVIKGASAFVAATIPPKPLALEALGYSLEALLLYATSLGLGSCWLGGTFDRSGFADAIHLVEAELLPVISPLGHPRDKRSPGDKIARWLARSDQRLPWDRLFFDQTFSQPLTEARAGRYATALALLRLAPSAANRQPWRVLKLGQTFHFYEQQSMKEGRQGVDIQKVDLGIAACHFGLCLEEQQIAGSFICATDGQAEAPPHTYYRFSWQARE
ncbi:nitroreductase [Oscillospiraceae bacterium HV4-5-C5C]|nr:nitroreductase [Oscillospiraceae bacterium HV4-5-C5C]